ncbi:MAG: benzoate/H(+) symporter BenE family transporter [Xanthobacter sp.]
MTMLRQLMRDSSASAIVAGAIATLISFAGPLVIVFQAASGLAPGLLDSWVWAISIGSGVLGIMLSLKYRVPVVVAWSAPGSALLVTLLPTVDFAAAVGAYLVASIILLLVGLSGAFDKLVSRLPVGISAAMLAGILFRFTVDMVNVVPDAPVMVLSMFAFFFAGRRWFPRYAVAAVLLVGLGLTLATGQMGEVRFSLAPTVPVWTMPVFEWQAMANIAVPLVVVSLTGQFLPGVAVLRTAGYEKPAAGPIITGCALGSAALAPFGCHGLNLAALTAAICMGAEAHEKPERRYVAGVVGGVLYLVFGTFAATVLGLFALLPPALIATLAGLALFPVVAGSLAQAVQKTHERDAALMTFIVSASGLSLLGLGAAFWGLVFGLLVHTILALHPRLAIWSRNMTPEQAE